MAISGVKSGYIRCEKWLYTVSAKEKSSTGTQQNNRKCSLVTPKTQYSNSAFQIAVLSEFEQVELAALHNSAILNN